MSGNSNSIPLVNIGRRNYDHATGYTRLADDATSNSEAGAEATLNNNETHRSRSRPPNGMSATVVTATASYSRAGKRRDDGRGRDSKGKGRYMDGDEEEEETLLGGAEDAGADVENEHTGRPGRRSARTSSVSALGVVAMIFLDGLVSLA